MFIIKVTTSKSKNSESFYISKSYINDKGKSTSVVVRKLGTLSDLLIEHGPNRENVMAWAKAQAKLETQKYKQERENKAVQITFHADRQLDFDKQTFYRGGYLFLQNIYYALQLNKTCRKLKAKYKFDYDINNILSDLIYSRILEPTSKRSSFKVASEFLEKPSYELHDIYRALDVLGNECDFIQAEVYKNSHFLGERNDKVLYYDCSNYYFEIEQESGSKKYGKSKEHRPNPIIQMGLFMDGDGIPLAFSTFPGNANEQTSLKPLEKKVLSEFGCQKFIYCSDAGLASEDIRVYNHMGERAYIVTQSIKKLRDEDKTWALNKKGFKRVSDDKPVDITKISEDDPGLYYKDESYTTKRLHQRLIVTYSPKYAKYQKNLRDKQVERAQKMIDNGAIKKTRKNPNDPARFIESVAATKDGALLGEALVICRDELKDYFRFHIKQKGALLAKGRLLGIQFLTLFENQLYFDLALHANTMASKLTEGITACGHDFLINSKTNQIFPVLPNSVIKSLQENFDFYVWSSIDESKSAIRLVTSWATPESAIEEFISTLKHT